MSGGTETGEATGPTTRNRHYGELAVDLAIVIGSALYVHAASHYPSQGRQIPTLVGWLAIGMGALHLLAHVVPGLWAVTHDSRARSRPKTVTAPGLADGTRAGSTQAGGTGGNPSSGMEAAGGDPVLAEAVAETVAGDALTGARNGTAAATEPAAAVAPVDPNAPPPVSLDVPPGEPRQVVAAMVWVVALLVAVYLFGFEVAVPAFFLAYFGVLRAWRTALISAVAMWGVTYGLFEMALGVPLPHGLL
jgi:hypothetical protein